MLHTKTLLAVLITIPATFLCAAIVTACTARTMVAPEPLGVDLRWPPPTSRVVSDSKMPLLGREYTTCSDNAVAAGDSLELPGDTTLAYAIYTLADLDAGASVARVGVDYSIQLGDPDNGTLLYVGIANYERGAWEWVASVPGGWSINTAQPLSYVSPGGVAALAVVLTGNGTATIEQVSFAVLEVTPPAPQNLAAEADVSRITLTWDEVQAAEGYHVYRKSAPGDEPVCLTETPVVLSTYVDELVGTSRIYYYYVTAVRGLESEPSVSVDVFVPAADLPPPPGAYVRTSLASSFTINWEWDGPEPTTFVLYYETTPDFAMFPAPQSVYAEGFMRSITVTGLPNHQVYYWRLGARDAAGKIGRLTDDQPSTLGNWSWGPAEEVGIGCNPLVAVEAENDLTVAYFSEPSGENFSDVVIARRDAGTWTTEVALPRSATAGAGFNTYLDLAHCNGTYLVAAYSVDPDDLCGAAGSPGGPWETFIIDGDNATGAGHDESGLYCRAAVGADEYAVLHLDATNSQWIVQYKTISAGSWSRDVVRSSMSAPLQGSLAYDEGNLYLVALDPVIGELLFGNRTADWALADVLPVGSTYLGANNQLVRWADTWITPAFDTVYERIYVVQGGDAPWDKTKIAAGENELGTRCRIALLENAPVVVFYGNATGTWYFAWLDDGNWHTVPILIDELVISSSADIAVLGSTPYFIFRESGSGLVMAAPGISPT